MAIVLHTGLNEISEGEKEVYVQMIKYMYNVLFLCRKESHLTYLLKEYAKSKNFCPEFTLLIRNIDLISSRNGITGRELSTTEYGLHTRLSMRLREPTWVCGPQSCPRYPCTLPVS